MKKYFVLFFIGLIFNQGITLENQDQKTEFIFIAGGSASGKTTFAKALANKIGNEDILIIHIDEYLDMRVQPHEDFIDAIPNFDNPSMVNWDLLITHLSDLKNHKSIERPIYSFSE